MSALVFVRDGRTLPFVPVTLAALNAIRATCDTVREASGSRRSYPHALATYMALLELANDNRADRVAVTQRELGERAQSSRSAVQAALNDLEVAGVLAVLERQHAGSRIENEYVVVEPAANDAAATNDTPTREKSDPRLSGKQLTQEEQKNRGGETHADKRDKIPDDFPDALRPHAREVMRILRAVSEQQGARKVWPQKVALVVMAHPRHALVAQAHKLAAWAVDAKRPIKDVVSTYQGFLDRDGELAAVERLADDGTPSAGQTAGATNVHPIRASNRNGKPTHGELISELRATNPRLQAQQAALTERT